MPRSASDIARAAAVCAIALAVFAAWLLTEDATNAGIGFFYVVPVGLAAWWGGRRGAAGAVLACSALYVAGALLQPVSHFAGTTGTRLFALAAVAVAVSYLRERLTFLEHSAEELEAIRSALAPSTLPELPGVDAAAAFVPSEYGVSGDFYLLTNGPDGSTVAMVGDVAGHGPRAARLATFLRARFAALASSSSDPAELLTMTNEALVELPRRARQLVSAACMRLDPERQSLSWALAGHPPPLRLPDLAELPAPGGTFLLGAGRELDLATGEASLAEGGGVVIYTDGATDVRRRGSLLGLEGLVELLAPLTRFPAQTIAAQAQRAILEWADAPIRDDLCVLVLKPKRHGLQRRPAA